jgi:TRAP-type C4-dicarboxylate transport system permease small subunit
MFKVLSRGLELLLEAICIVLMVSLAVIVLWAVLYRQLNLTLVWYDEVASVLLAYLTYYGAALAALKRAHLGFPGLFNVLPLGVRKPVFLVAEILVIGFFAVLGWYGYRVLDVMYGEALVTVRWASLALVQSVIPIGAVLFIVAEVLSFPEAWRRVVVGTDAEAEEIDRVVREASESSEGRTS